MYLRTSLNAAILQTLRVSSRPGVVSSPWPDGEGRPDRGEAWDRLQAHLSSKREQRLAYLLYHCGLKPAEIVHYCPHEWSNVQKVVRMRSAILARLMKGYGL